MIRKAKRYFNTSGPNITAEHYTLSRPKLLGQGLDLVKKKRYFTIWAPRQTGKSTYFRMLTEELLVLGYKVTHINVENYKDVPLSSFLNYLFRAIKENWGLSLESKNFGDLHNDLASVKNQKYILIIDEIEGLNEAILGQFLLTIRNLYQYRDEHSLNSVILVGVANIAGIVEDNASPFNIADNLEVPYFSSEEIDELLGMHEQETGQLFSPAVKNKIASITAGQPGLVNGFAYQLVTRYPAKPVIEYEDYLKVENWYIKKAIDKNISNIINKARQHRQFVEQLLFDERLVEYAVNDERVKFLTTSGVITSNEDGFITFHVPLYKKVLFDAFYPYTNGESSRFLMHIDLRVVIDKDTGLNFDLIIEHYKEYVKRRSFKYFREKDGVTGEYKSIKEAALAYSFETYIQSLVQAFKGKSYLEPHSGMGRCDLLINIAGWEYVIEFKIFRDILRFEEGKQQVAYYARSLGLKEAVYLVFVPNTVKLPGIKEGIEDSAGIRIKTYIVPYDEEKDF